LVARGKTKSEEKGVKRKLNSLKAESLKTCEGAGAPTKEQGGTFCSLTACYCVELVSLSEVMPIRPEEDSLYPPKISSHDAFLLFGLLSQ
jgi:hypothetical protein